MIELIHSFKDQCYNPAELFNDCNKIGVFCRRLKVQSVLHPERIEPNTYKGDGLEILVEAYLKLHPADSRIGITDYRPEQECDYGVDGVGRGNNGKVATVQVKYRSPIRIMTANKDHLSNFVANSYTRYGVDLHDTENMIIITTAAGVHHKVMNEMFNGKVKVIAIDDLKKMLNWNNLFWEAFREAFFRCRVLERAVVSKKELRIHQVEAVAAILAQFEEVANG